MGENPTNPQQEEELAKARKSMGGRIDPDPEPEGEAVVVPEPKKEEPKAPEAEPAKPVIEPETIAEDDKKPVVEPPKPNRPETFIPMPKYLSEKDDWKNTIAAKDTALAEAQQKIEELTVLASQNNGAQKDEDIEAFMDKTGMTRETVDGLLDLAAKRLTPKDVMSTEQREAVEKATAIVKEAEIEAQFENEFKDIGEPAILKAFPNATPEAIAKAKDYLDKVSHTKANFDKPLNFLVFNYQEELAKVLAETEPEKPPQNKKVMEPSRPGAGRQSTFSADDYRDGKTSFDTLADMDPAVRSELIKNFDPKTYSAFVQHTKGYDKGLEVMRNGRKVSLK